MLRLTFGSLVFWKEEQWLLIGIPEVDRVLLKHPKTGRAELVGVSELKAKAQESNRQIVSLINVSDDEWKQAYTRFEKLSALVRQTKRARTYQDIDEVAHHFGKNRVTIYRWLNKLDKDQKVSSLLRVRRSDHGKLRLNEAIEEIISEKINTFYLVKERPSLVELWEQIAIACREKGLKTPSQITVNRRVDRIQDRLLMAKRYSHKKARAIFEPIRGSFPNANVPLAVYQVDHTPVDVMIVDDIHRQPIGRAFLTIVIDTCTRMLAGFCITLDPPGAMSAGLALAHAILPKKMWLAKYEIDAEWPIYGIPQKIYADNAAEFRGNMLARACQEYGIIMENRPKGLPNYGGHVERLFRTFMKRVQSLPGTTFSNTSDRGEYESEKKAILSLSEFEHWFSIFVTKVYHHRANQGIGGVPPIKLYERFIFGDEHTKSIGLPMPIQDERKLRLDFLPFEERTIQEYGVRIDHIEYYADILRSWIHARDPKNSKLARKFIFAYDPRDISMIYFLDPETGVFYDIPYGNTARPPMSRWELKLLLKQLKEHPDRIVNEDLIFEGLKEMRQVQELASQRSKQARRFVQRRSDARKKTKPALPLAQLESVDIPVAEDWGHDIQPFEVEEQDD